MQTMSEFKTRDPTKEEIETINHRYPRGAYIATAKQWYFETKKEYVAIDITESTPAGSPMYLGFHRAIKVLGLEGKVKLSCLKTKDKDRIILQRLKQEE
jgi:hypothetical protein